MKIQVSLLSLLLSFLVLLSGNAHAATPMWKTPAGGISKAYLPSAYAACEKQKAVYAPENEGPVTASATKYWNIKECGWKSHLEGGPINPLPGTVVLVCLGADGTADSNYSLVPPGICVPDRDTAAPRNACDATDARPNPTTGNPIILSTGAKFETVLDYTNPAQQISVSRVYQSNYGNSGEVPVNFGLGELWRFDFQWQIKLHRDFSQNGEFRVTTPKGAVYVFTLETNSTLTNESGVNDFKLSLMYSGTAPTRAQILASGAQFRLRTHEGDLVTIGLFKAVGETGYRMGYPLEIDRRHGTDWDFAYGTDGDLLSITDSFGRVIGFEWAKTPQRSNPAILVPQAISRVTLPDGTKLEYGYDAYDSTQTGFGQYARLKTFRRLNSAGALLNSATYHYEDSDFPYGLTGVTDHGGVRYATWAYDDSGRAVLSEHAGGKDRYTVEYSSNGTGTYSYRKVINPHGKETFYTFKRNVSTGVMQLQSAVGTPTSDCLGTTQSMTYNSGGRMATEVDAGGITKSYTYYSDGRRQRMTEAVGKPEQRVTDYIWHADFNLPTRITKPRLTVDYGYDSRGRLTLVRQTDTSAQTIPYSTNGNTREWKLDYNASGQLREVDGPLAGNADTQSYDYTAAGFLRKVTNALGHAWEVTQFDSAGRPTQVTEPNGVLSLIVYDGLGRVTSLTTAGLATTVSYNAVGLLDEVQLPDGRVMDYSYDAARRITRITDEDGNRIDYTLDVAGNPLQVEVRDASGNLRRSQSRVYDALNRLRQLQGANGQMTALGYDLRDNLTTETVAGQFTTQKEFDPLNRLAKVTDAAQGITRYTHDELDRVATVTDPRGLVTGYTYDGFDNLLQLVSPDSGTSVYTYDLAGNMLSQRDAKNQLTSMQYDLLGRRLSATSQGSAVTSYIYDQGSHGKGRLTSESNSASVTSWTYDAQGRVTLKRQWAGGQALDTSYTHDSQGRVATQTLPSGHVIGFNWSGSRLGSVTLDGAALASGFSWEPYGPAGSWSFANGEQVNRTWDLSGRMTSYSLGTITYDSADRITGLSRGGLSHLGGAQTYGYDSLDRLVSYNGSSVNIGYAYDANGNRTQQTGTTGTLNYGIASGSNRVNTMTTTGLSQVFSYDANGSMTSDGLLAFAYNDEGRLATAGGTSYGYNPRGQRVIKSAAGTTTLFVHDEAGHLVGEYDPAGIPVRETVWMGDTPVAVIKGGTAYYIHTDHLNTPRQIDNASGDPVWVWAR